MLRYVIIYLLGLWIIYLTLYSKSECVDVIIEKKPATLPFQVTK